MFSARKSVEQVEEGIEFAPKFDEAGLITVIITEVGSGEVLMLGYMNQEALIKTLKTGEAHYWSRSRKCLWRKGEHSGLSHHVEEVRIDDDQDAIWLCVRLGANDQGQQASCHVGYRSCFYRLVEHKSDQTKLVFCEEKKVFDPQKVYEELPNPTRL